MIRKQDLHGARVAGMALTVALAALSGCSEEEETAFERTVVIDVTTDQVASVTFTADGESATYTEHNGVFVPGPGGTAEFATLLGLAEPPMFPVNAYRVLDADEAVDPSTPAYGLAAATATSGARPEDCGSGCSLEVTADDGTTWRLGIGARSFNEAGFYARLAGDPRVFLLITATVADLISYARGGTFTFPPSRNLQQTQERIERVGAEASGEGEPSLDPYLRQVIAAEQAAEAARKGRPSKALRQAATSLEEQMGAEPLREGAAGAPAQEQPDELNGPDR